MNLAFAFARDRRWWRVNRDHPAARALADRHYSRGTPGAKEFTPPGRVLCLITLEMRAVWTSVEHLDPAGNLVWRCSVFRSECLPDARHAFADGAVTCSRCGELRSSALVREATAVTYLHWERHYGGRPAVTLRTEVDPAETTPKRDPGRCFARAGWTRLDGLKRGLVHLEAPPVCIL